MTIEPVDAWLLHKRNSGDTSLWITCFTREQGLISMRYQGGRTPKKQALLQAFTPLWLFYTEKGEQRYIRGLEPAAPGRHLTGDALFSGWYLNELLMYALKPNDPHAQLYDGYVSIINQLQSNPARAEIARLLRRFEWALLTVSGYHFDLHTDSHSGHAIALDQYYRLNVSSGLFQATEGYLGAHLLAIAADDLSDPAVLKTAKLLMRQAIDQLTGGRILVSRRLYSANPG